MFFVGVGWSGLGNLLFIAFGLRKKNLERTKQWLVSFVSGLTGASKLKTDDTIAKRARDCHVELSAIDRSAAPASSEAGAPLSSKNSRHSDSEFRPSSGFSVDTSVA